MLIMLLARPQGYKSRILGECLLISSLPGKALRMIVEITRFAKRFNMYLVNLISKDADLISFLSAYPLIHSSNKQL